MLVMFGRKSLFDLIQKEARVFPEFAGFASEIKSAGENTNLKMGIMRKYLQNFNRQGLASFLERYENRVNAPDAILLLHYARSVYDSMGRR
jgi:hypothetical protein